jgi:hypothetical protein
MKKILLPFLLFQTISFLSIGQTSLSGKVTAENTGEELIGANITLKMKGVFVVGVGTDFNGNYSLTVDPGTYDVEVSFVGYPENLIRRVVVKPGQSNKLDIRMTDPEGVLMDEIVVTEYKLRCFEVDNTTRSFVVTSQEIRNLPTRNVSALASDAAGLSQVDKSNEVTLRSSRCDPTDYYIDGIRVRGTETGSSENNTELENGTGKTKIDATKKELSLNAGILTVGEWNGLEDWKFWENLLETQDKKHQQNWQIFLSQRFSVKVVNQAGFAISDCVVKLLDKSEKIVWQSKTDNAGQAELWANIYGGKGTDFKIIATSENISSKAQKAIPYHQKINKIKLPVDCTAFKNLDIAFVVDATGSMRDEIKFLKTELRDVIDQVAENSEGLNIQTSSVFYRDDSDEYVTRNSPFTNNLDETIAFIEKQTATGGGDYIEAVDIALAEALKMNWRENAIARILFLVMDAPPSNKPEVLKKLHDQIRKAAELGVQIIPIAASGVNQSTAFLMKSIAIATNGTYVFITDHSGVGNAHLEVAVSGFNAESLNELMVELIIAFSEQKGCETQNQNLQLELSGNFNHSSLLSKNQNPQFYFYPNPADGQVFIELKENFKSIRLINVSGKILKIIEYPKAGITKLSLSDLPSGVYFLQFQKGAELISRRLMVVKP